VAVCHRERERKRERERQIRKKLCEKGSQRSEVCVLFFWGDSEREKGRKKVCVCVCERERECVGGSRGDIDSEGVGKREKETKKRDKVAATSFMSEAGCFYLGSVGLLGEYCPTTRKRHKPLLVQECRSSPPGGRRLHVDKLDRGLRRRIIRSTLVGAAAAAASASAASSIAAGVS